MGDDVAVRTELVIKDKETIRLAEELAALRKMSVAEMLALALRDELELEREAQRRLARMEEIADGIRAHAIYPMVRSDHSWLYDENGLPA